MPSYLVALLGARLHYAVPRILFTHDMLERLDTDFEASSGWPRLLGLIPPRIRPRALSKMLQRRAGGIPPSRIAAYNALGIGYGSRMRKARSQSERLETYLWAGRELGRRVIRNGFGKATGVYTFNSAGLEILQAAKQRGLRTVMEQTIAPFGVEQRLMFEEKERYPDWLPEFEDSPLVREFADREKEEWKLADLVIGASEFVSEGYAAEGGDAAKFRLIPYGVDLPEKPISTKSSHSRLRVLTVGEVGVRKGSQYVWEAARRMQGSVDFRMVGPINLPAGPERDLRQVAELTGSRPRNEMGEHYNWADVFLLPSICEGSALVCYEAMAAGLPVIATPNAGSVVRDEIDGFVVPNRDVSGMISRLDQLTGDRIRLGELASSARHHIADFTLAQYSRRLIAALGDPPCS